MNGQEFESTEINLVGNQSVLFRLVRDEQNASAELNCVVGDDSFQVPVSSRFSEASFAHYLIGMALVDLAALNLGSRVVIAGAHELDSAVRDIVELAPAISVLSARDEVEDESVDAFIGCDVKGFVQSLPSLRRGGIVVATCAFDDDERLDLYGSLHRKGLSFRSLDLRRDVGVQLPILAARFERLVDSDSSFLGNRNVRQGSE